MSIFDNFRSISGAEIYRETCDIVKEYRLKYQVEAVVPTDDPEEQQKRHKMKRKSFYLDSFANRDWFIQFGYAPVNGKFLPFLVRICKSPNIVISEEGIKCNPEDISIFAYDEEYCLADWKKAKKQLIAAIEYALDTGNIVQSHWGDWLAGEEDKTLIHYEQAKKANTVIIKKAKKPATETDNA